jgi:predicted TIM-barrel fold metal-dependent hydrolase
MKPASFTPQQLLKQAQPAGVSRIVLIQMSFYGFDNSYMLDAISAHPGVFSGVAVINDQVARPQDTMRALAQRGVRGFRLYPQQRPIDRWFASEGLQSMWRCGAQQNLAMCLLVNPDALPAIDKMCAKYPETPVVIDHFARIGIDGTIRPSDLDQLCRLARHKRTRVKVSAFYALGKKQAPYTDLVPMIKRLLAAFGPQRLMWATDCPYQVQDAHTYADSIALVRDHLKGISDDDRQWLLRKTAQRVFF